MAACGSRPPDPPARTEVLRARNEPVHIDMATLHQEGGVPRGWRFSVPAGDVAEGRRAFVELGCHSCHAVKGEAFSAPTTDGPALTGMGSHHPPEYFAESILNPDAVVVGDGASADGEEERSRMPVYPDLTLLQLADLVAYLQSLKDETAHAMPPPSNPVGPRPPPPATDASVHFVQVFDVREGQLDAFQAWFQSTAVPALRAVDGLVGVDTYVDNTRGGAGIVTIMSFRDDGALARFLQDPAGAEWKRAFDSFIGPHGHQLFRYPPIYRVDGLSLR